MSTQPRGCPAAPTTVVRAVDPGSATTATTTPVAATPAPAAVSSAEALRCG
jgi:hypothetical protein